MILLDYNQVALSGVFQFMKEINPKNPEKSKDIIRHAILSSILSNKKKYTQEYGELVITADGNNYWRKDKFEFYKANRKTSRDASDIDWKFIFEILSETREDLKENFPYKVLHIEGCEADDIIAVLCKWTQENDLTDNVLFSEAKKTLILSSDHDFAQLHQYDNIRQWAPAQKKFVPKPKNIKHFINEHIAKGDSGDGVPSILSNDNCFVEKIRQSPMTKKRLEEFLEQGIGACRNDTEIRNWHRNELLVCFDKIPDYIEQRILEEFTKETPKNGKGKIFNYLVKNKMRLLLDSIEDF